MKKTYKLFLALVACLLSGVSVNAEIISLQEVPFGHWDGWGANAKMTEQITPAWVVGESTGLPYGDDNVINYADLSNFTKLIVVSTEGTPRFLFNRDIDNGQWDSDESKSHLIDNTRGGWSSKYFTTDAGVNEGETVYTVDLKQLAKDKGYAHLHSIKGANYGNVTVLSMELERQAKAPVGWTSIIKNGNFEGEDTESFVLALEANKSDNNATHPAEITDGVGKNESRGLMVSSMADAYETWSTQLFVKLGETLTEGMKWRFTMDVKADAAAHITTGCHAAPRDWKAGGIINEFDVTDEWQTITAEGTINADQGKAGIQSIAFDLNNDKVNANTFYFDNINFEVFKLGTVAEFSNDVILLDFGFDTNIPELVKKSGKKRLMYPLDCATVKVNGNDVELYSIEALEDGRFYIFTKELNEDDDEIIVSFNNPADPAYQIVYASGAVSGQVVGNVDALVASNNSDVEDNEGYPYDFVIPTIMSSDPESGAFNLPNSISEFKLKFDKEVDAEKLTAKLGTIDLTVNPVNAVEGFAEEFTLTRQGEDLVNGEYSLRITNIFPKLILDEELFGDTTLVFNVGKTEDDPTDVSKELIPEGYFANCANGSIPEGFFVKFGSEDRPGGNGYGSGSRMFDFAAGGDFTKGLYFREGYVEYGTTAPKIVVDEGDGDEKEVDYSLNLEAGKKYDFSFMSAQWKDSGDKLCFRVFFKEDYDAAIGDGAEPQAILSQVVSNTPNVNGSTGAVSGATKTVIRFVPEITGKYVLRWVSTGNQDGAPEYKEILLANPSVKYIPNKAGIELITMLNNALDAAKGARDGNADARYAGDDYTALAEAIDRIDGEKDGYYNPSSFEKAAELLNTLAQALKDHRALCDNYDAAIKKTIDVERQNKETKFNVTDLYAQVVEMNAKYHGSSEWINVADVEADPEAEDWQLTYNFDKLTENESLKVAIDELQSLGNTTSLLFTEGVSAPGNANGGKGTGVAVATDRIRRAVIAMKQMGIDENDPLIVEANKALTDDDDLVQALKDKITLFMYTDLAKGDDSKLFVAEEDPVTFETKSTEYDLTVFVKNPNIYKQLPNMDFTEENVPGWITPEGYNKPGLSVGWGAPSNIEGVAEDCMFQTWGASYRVEQTITDLPAGKYNIFFGFSDRDSADDLSNVYAYVNTSNADEGTEEFTGSAEAIGQAFPFAESSGSIMIEGVEVTDGILTLGVNASDGSKTFFNDVHVILVDKAADVDYEQAKNDKIETGIEDVQKAATVSATEMFDINGRRVSVAPRGVVIVKKHMSDGTVRMQKVVKQ